MCLKYINIFEKPQERDKEKKERKKERESERQRKRERLLSKKKPRNTIVS